MVVRNTHLHQKRGIRPLAACLQSQAGVLGRLASGYSPVAVELDGKVGHDLQGLVGQLQVHGDGAHLAGEGA